MNEQARSSNFLFSRKRGARTRGQATVEYALLIGVAALIGLAFLSTFTQVINESFVTFNAVLERELITAGFPEADEGWEN